MTLTIQIAAIAAALVLIAGILSRFVRGVLADHAAQVAALLDRIQAPEAAAVRAWQMPQAPPQTIDDLDAEWMRQPEAQVGWDNDLALLGDDESEER